MAGLSAVPDKPTPGPEGVRIASVSWTIHSKAKGRLIGCCVRGVTRAIRIENDTIYPAATFTILIALVTLTNTIARTAGVSVLQNNNS